MTDRDARLEKLRTDAADCALISELATDLDKRHLFARLAAHLRNLANDVEREITAPADGGIGASKREA